MKAKPPLLIVSFALVAILATAGPLLCGQPNEIGSGWATWVSLGGDFRRSGLSQDAGPAPNCVKWTFETGGSVVGSVTVGAENQIHVACEDGKLYTLDTEGASLWVLDVNAPLVSAPSIGPDGGLYVGARDGSLYATDSQGALRWTYDTGDAIYSSPAIAPSGEVYVASTDGTLYALDRDGAELWQFTTHGPGVLPAGCIFASPAIGADGTVYIAGLYDPNLYALDPTDGSVKWACRFPPAQVGDEEGWPFVSPVVAEDGTIYQTLLYDRHLYAIDSNDGAVLWRTDLLDPNSGLFDANDTEQYADADGWSEPVLGPDGTIYVSLDDPFLRAVGPDGNLKWATRLGEVGGFTLTVDREGWVYATGDDGHVYVVDSTGLEIGRIETGGWPAFPVLAAEGLLIVADSQDYSSLNTDAKNAVYAVSSECPDAPGAGDEESPSP